MNDRERHTLEAFAADDAYRITVSKPSLLFDRVTVLIVSGIIVVIALIIAALSLLVANRTEPQPPVEKSLGPLNFLVSTEMPPRGILLATAFVLVAVALLQFVSSISVLLVLVHNNITGVVCMLWFVSGRVMSLCCLCVPS